MMLRCMEIGRITGQADGRATVPVEWPPSRLRNGPRYLSIRTEQLVHENERLGLPARHAVMLTYLQLESEAERRSRRRARRASWYSSLYVTPGLPAAILAAIACHGPRILDRPLRGWCYRLGVGGDDCGRYFPRLGQEVGSGSDYR